jgi:hypothetical protein
MNIQKQPIINETFQKHFSQQVCDLCGNNETSAIFKNDLLNDPRLYDVNSQTFNDFHSLCVECAREKTRVGTFENKHNRFYSNKEIIILKCFFDDANDYRVVDDNENMAFDPTDINAKINTFWYDPVKFMTKVHERYSQIHKQLIERHNQLNEQKTQLKEQYTQVTMN